VIDVRRRERAGGKLADGPESSTTRTLFSGLARRAPVHPDWGASFSSTRKIAADLVLSGRRAIHSSRGPQFLHPARREKHVHAGPWGMGGGAQEAAELGEIPMHLFVTPFPHVSKRNYCNYCNVLSNTGTTLLCFLPRHAMESDWPLAGLAPC
jgi:hypothetical protein